MSSISDDYIEVTIDVAKVNRMFKELNMSTDESRKALRRGLAASARVIQRQAKTNLNTVQNKASGTTLASKNLKKWVKYVVYKRTLGFRVHIQQSKGGNKKENKSYVLKWLEDGTKPRWQKYRKWRPLKQSIPFKTKKRYTGKITASHFFSRASNDKIDESKTMLQKNIEKYIQKIANKR